MGTMTSTSIVSFQLMNIRTNMLPMIVRMFLNKKVMLLLTADLAWLMSLPRRLFSSPVLNC